MERKDYLWQVVAKAETRALYFVVGIRKLSGDVSVLPINHNGEIVDDEIVVDGHEFWSYEWCFPSELDPLYEDEHDDREDDRRDEREPSDDWLGDDERDDDHGPVNEFGDHREPEY